MIFQKFAFKQGLEEKLAELGILDKIKTAVETDDFAWADHHMFSDTASTMLTDLKERGYFKHKSDETKQQSSGLRNFLNKPEKHKWVISRPSGELIESADLDHFPILSGYLASLVLSPEDFWNFKKFDFSSSADLQGTIGAYMKQPKSQPWDEGYIWESELEDKTKFVSEVTGSMHGDFRLFRDNHTYYLTKDPLGNEVSYKPIFLSEKQFVSGYHSVEPGLLATIIKYIDQFEIPSNILKDKGRAILSEFRAMAQHSGPFADFGDDSFGDSTMAFFLYDCPFPIWGETEKRKLGNIIPTEFHGQYELFVDGVDKSLIFSTENKNNSYDIALRLPSNEIDHLIRGLFVQAQKGKGRTAVRQLTEVINYRFSTKFEEDRKKWQEYLKK